MDDLSDDASVRLQMGALHSAFRHADLATLERILADDFTFSDPNGPTVGKQRWLDDIASGNLVFDSVETGPVQVRRVGDRAVVDGEARLIVRYTESDYTGRFRFLGVFRYEDGQWRLELTSAERLVDDERTPDS
jgi:ketosteroid isomerase-like protein